jgi:hypothetical protein
MFSQTSKVGEVSNDEDIKKQLMLHVSIIAYV